MIRSAGGSGKPDLKPPLTPMTTVPLLAVQVRSLLTMSQSMVPVPVMPVGFVDRRQAVADVRVRKVVSQNDLAIREGGCGRTARS